MQHGPCWQMDGRILQSLINAGVKRVKMVRLPDLPVKGDVSDLFDAEETTADEFEKVR